MSEMRELIRETTERFLADVSSREKWEAQPHDSLAGTDWKQLTELGLPRVAVPELLGGSGGDFGDMCELAFVSGYAASYFPLTETMLGYWLCGLAGLELPEDAVPILALGTLDEVVDGNALVRGIGSTSIVNVPAARFATHLLLPRTSGPQDLALALLPASDVIIEGGSNAADEPRDRVKLVGTRVADAMPVPFGPDRLVRVCAVLHALQIAGAMHRALDMTITYTQERSQFGRNVAKFQAVQHMIAQAAAHVGAAATVSRLAAECWETPSFDLMAACAKGRASEAVKIVTDVAHQCFGAMGFTRECLLHVFTRRLWCWREEYGNERIWYARIGNQMRRQGSDDIWGTVTSVT